MEYSAMPQKNVLQGLFSLLRELNLSLLTLRLESLPQPVFLMLRERSAELYAAMRRSARKTHKRKRQAAARGWQEPLESLKQTLAATHVLLRQLRDLRRAIDLDLSTAEGCIRYNDFPWMMQTIKQRLRTIGADAANSMGTAPPAHVFKQNTDALKDVTRHMGQLTKIVAELNQWADKQTTAHSTTLDAIFTCLETDAALASINKDVSLELRGVAYNNIVASGLFDESFYLSQLPNCGKGVRDSLKNYLTQTHDASPCPFFNNAYYKEQSKFVQMLRYNPLEHFARYGETMRLSPGPELDVIFYLKNNEDILNAGISPYRHFVHHGVNEGRQPSAHAGGFLSREYMGNAGGRLAFVGEPDDGERLAWEALRTQCLKRDNGKAVSVPVAGWSAFAEKVDGFVVGAAALAVLDEKRLSALARSGASLVYLGENPQDDLQGLLGQSIFPLARICAVTNAYERFLRWQEDEAPIRLLYYPFANMEDSLPLANAMLSKLARREAFPLRRFVQPAQNDDGTPKPVISVVSIIYKKPEEMLAFLESINRQDLVRPYEVVLVDDASPDDTVDRVQAWLTEKQASGLLNCRMDVRILRNAVNSGNCISRNKGIEAARSDIILVADGDMVFGVSNLSEHVWAYRFGDCDAVLGFFRFDLNKAFVFDWLAACEIDEAIVHTKLVNLEGLISSHGRMQFISHSIFNFITKNVSFRKSFFKDEYFDPAFSYSAKPDSGYGVEDQEFGAKIYFSGGKIRFVERAIAMHILHADNSYNESRAMAMLRNWEKLLVKHPDLVYVDRQYYQQKTVEFLHRTASRQETPEHVAARARYAAPDRVNVTVRVSRPLRILTYAWDADSQYDLFKMGKAAFVLATNIGTRHCDQWAYDQRPLPRNVRLAPLEAIKPDEYDLAILPCDGHVLSPAPGKVPADWGNAFLTMLEVTKDIPRVALCHDAPPRAAGDSADADRAMDEAVPGSRVALRDLLGDIHVVCASHQAQREWGFARSSVIWHGFWPVEFPPGKHSRGCLTLPRQAFEDSPLVHGEAVRRRVAELLGKQPVLEYAAPPPPHPGYTVGTQERAMAQLQNIVEYLGDFALYFNPTRHCPMPRLRGEAMMTGTIPVSLRNHDVDMFIQNGVNGFYGDSPEELAEQMRWLWEHEKERREISRQARLMALDVFNIDRHLAAWSELLRQVA